MTEAMEIKMEKKVHNCAKHLKIEDATELFTKMCVLTTRQDPRHTSSEVPEWNTTAQQQVFCEIYDKLVEHYKALSVTDPGDVLTHQWHKAVNCMNRMLHSKPAMNEDGQVMAGFYFDQECFVAEEAATRKHHKKLVAINAFYLVLAGVNQKIREQSMRPMTPSIDR